MSTEEEVEGATIELVVKVADVELGRIKGWKKELKEPGASSGSRGVCWGSRCSTLAPKWLLTGGSPSTRSTLDPLRFRDADPECVRHPVLEVEGGAEVCGWLTEVGDVVESWMGIPLRVSNSVDVSGPR